MRAQLPIRRQLSLFVPRPVRDTLDELRRRVDPVQHRLIPAHVTLCREDELGGIGLADLEQRLRPVPGPLTLAFGPPERFAEHGILLPCIDGTEDFDSLRAVALAVALAVARARPHAPHLTLAHPRNPRVPANDLDAVASLRPGLRITFEEVHLIEQVDDKPWVVRGSIPLVADAPADD